MPYPDELIEFNKQATQGNHVLGFITEEQLKAKAMEPGFKEKRERSKADYAQIEKRRAEVKRAQQVSSPNSSNGFDRFRNSLMNMSNELSAKEQNEMSMDMLASDEGANLMASKLLGRILNADLSMAFPASDEEALNNADRFMDISIICFNTAFLRDTVKDPLVKDWLSDNKTLLESFNRSNMIQEYYAKDTALFMDRFIPDIENNMEKIITSVNPMYMDRVNIVQDMSTISPKEISQIREFIDNGGIDKNDFLFTKAYKTDSTGKKVQMSKLDALRGAASGDKTISFEPMKPEERQRLEEALKNPMGLSKEQRENATPDFTKSTKDMYDRLHACEGVFRRNEPEFNEIKKMTQDYMKLKKPTAEQSYKFFRSVQMKAKKYVQDRAKNAKNMNPTMKKYYDTLNDLSKSLVNDVARASAANFKERFDTKYIERAMERKNEAAKSMQERKENKLHDKFMSFSDKVISGKMPHCSGKNFKDLIFISASSTLSPVFENGATAETGKKYVKDFANVLAAEMILGERLELNGKEAMVNPKAELKVGPLEQMLNKCGAMEFTKAIAKSDFIKNFMNNPKATEYFNQKGIIGVKKAFTEHLKKDNNMVKFESTVKMPEQKTKQIVKGAQVGAAQ